MCRYDGIHFSSFNHIKQVETASILAISESLDKTIWVSTDAPELFTIKNNAIASVGDSLLDGKATVAAMIHDLDGNLFMGVTGIGVCMYAASGLEVLIPLDSLSGSN
ncbi:MAG: hypothetical protein CUN56_17045, partial [Phototrophicales bacterium]